MLSKAIWLLVFPISTLLANVSIGELYTMAVESDNRNCHLFRSLSCSWFKINVSNKIQNQKTNKNDKKDKVASVIDPKKDMAMSTKCLQYNLDVITYHNPPSPPTLIQQSHAQHHREAHPLSYPQ